MAFALSQLSYFPEFSPCWPLSTYFYSLTHSYAQKGFFSPSQRHVVRFLSHSSSRAVDRAFCFPAPTALKGSTFHTNLTTSFLHLSRNLDEDAGVADNHDQQGQQEEETEGEHVVENFLPVSMKTSHGGTLDEVGGLGAADGVEDKHLERVKHPPQTKRQIRAQNSKRGYLIGEKGLPTFAP